MCGIAGSFNMPKMTLDKVYSLMSHRGPNAKGILEEMTKGGFAVFSRKTKHSRFKQRI